MYSVSVEMQTKFAADNIRRWPASWSSGQSVWLLIMKFRVRFPTLPWGFSLQEEDSYSDHGLGSLVELRFKVPSWSFIFIYHHPPHRDNVTAPHGLPNLRSRLHFGHNREGRPRSLQGSRGIREKKIVDWLFNYSSSICLKSCQTLCWLWKNVSRHCRRKRLWWLDVCTLWTLAWRDWEIPWTFIIFFQIFNLHLPDRKQDYLTRTMRCLWCSIYEKLCVTSGWEDHELVSDFVRTVTAFARKDQVRL
jgi:hypothetical protein